MPNGERPATLGDLRRAEYLVVPTRQEIRRNLLSRLASGQPSFPGLLGYNDTVIPSIETALLAGQDIILLGERGQAKSRITRALTALLDDFIPTIAGCDINDSPWAPICAPCRQLVAERGDATEIAWLTPQQRYSEKLATPDVSIADLIGEVDPIKVAEGRYLSDELTIHYGLIPRTNRGIFAINELPDLAERIQVGLLSIIEERDVQIRGYRLRLPLDVVVVATANPEDYTNRGRIITPLKDRFGAQIRTHYPTSIDDEMAIVDQEATRFDGDPVRVRTPAYMATIVAEVTHVARSHAQVNQRSGVSVRVSIANAETVAAAALRRALLLDEKDAVVRVSDLRALVSSTAGKLEFETWDDADEAAILQRILQTAVSNVFRRHFSPHDFSELISRFDSGALTAEVGARVPVAAYTSLAADLPEIERARQALAEPATPAAMSAVVEFVLEGLYLSKRLNKTELESSAIYAS